MTPPTLLQTAAKRRICIKRPVSHDEAYSGIGRESRYVFRHQYDQLTTDLNLNLIDGGVTLLPRLVKWIFDAVLLNALAYARKG
jgi:hypothetical protein